MAISIEQNARFEAAHKAYRVVEQNGVDAGSEILRGYFTAYMRALAAVEGWETVRELIFQHGEGLFVPGRRGKLQLVVSNTAEVMSA